jgi:HAMP domain-containing protein
VLGIFLAAVITLALQNLTPTQFTVAVTILALFALVFGFILMWLLSWLTATPVRMVRSALRHVEDGDFDCEVVVFDGTELGELQRGFNSMVGGLRERERVRDLFGRHVGREVAGNVGAKERFEYTVIGEPVNEAARLCELAKNAPRHLLASSVTVASATESEGAHWTLGDTVTLRGHDEPTTLALPV